MLIGNPLFAGTTGFCVPGGIGGFPGFHGIRCIPMPARKGGYFPPCTASWSTMGGMTAQPASAHSGRVNMGKARTGGKKGNGNGANLGFEEKLWAAADKLRGHMDAAEYKHVVLGLIFLKYISDAFEEAPRPPRGRPRAPTRRTATSTRPRTSSGCRRRPAGTSSRTPPSSRPSARSSTTRWSRSRRTTHRSRACCRRTTPGPSSTRRGSAS